MGKRFRYSRSLLLSLCTCFFLAAGACAAMNGYTVEPVTPGMDTGTPFDAIPTMFWNLPPGIMLSVLAFPTSAIVGFPLELYLLLKLYACMGYRKITKKTILHNEIRSSIYSCIQENPGINHHMLGRMTGVNRGTLRYHLITLKLAGKISILASGNNPRYFENSGVYSPAEKTVLKYLRNDMDNKIFRALMETPALTRYELGEILGVSHSTVSWRMNRLIDEKLICTYKCGRNVHYGVTPDARQYLEKYLVMARETLSPAIPGQVSESA